MPWAGSQGKIANHPAEQEVYTRLSSAAQKALPTGHSQRSWLTLSTGRLYEASHLLRPRQMPKLTQKAAEATAARATPSRKKRPPLNTGCRTPRARELSMSLVAPTRPGHACWIKKAMEQFDPCPNRRSEPDWNRGRIQIIASFEESFCETKPRSHLLSIARS